jgi:hypothetical protein
MSIAVHAHTGLQQHSNSARNTQLLSTGTVFISSMLNSLIRDKNFVINDGTVHAHDANVRRCEEMK